MIAKEDLSTAARRHAEPCALTDCDETLGSVTQPHNILARSRTWTFEDEDLRYTLVMNFILMGAKGYCRKGRSDERVGRQSLSSTIKSDRGERTPSGTMMSTS